MPPLDPGTPETSVREPCCCCCCCCCCGCCCCCDGGGGCCWVPAPRWRGAEAEFLLPRLSLPSPAPPPPSPLPPRRPPPPLLALLARDRGCCCCCCCWARVWVRAPPPPPPPRWEGDTEEGEARPLRTPPPPLLLMLASLREDGEEEEEGCTCCCRRLPPFEGAPGWDWDGDVWPTALPPPPTDAGGGALPLEPAPLRSLVHRWHRESRDDLNSPHKPALPRQRCRSLQYLAPGAGGLPHFLPADDWYAHRWAILKESASFSFFFFFP